MPPLIVKFHELSVGFLLLTLVNISNVYSQSPCDKFTPEWIALGITTSPATQQTVSWRSSKGSRDAMAQLVKEDPSPNLEDLATTYYALSNAYSDYGVEKDYHRVTFNNLEPGTVYLYRIGNNGCWSEWYQFKTALGSPKPFSFLYFGDVQYQIRSLFPRVLRQAILQAPSSALMVFAGDLTSNATHQEFDDFFRAGDWILASKPIVPVPDGHEYPKDSLGMRHKLASFWELTFAYPSNAPKELEGVGNYYFDYQNTRFILFNTFDYSVSGRSKLYLEWLESLLQNNPQKWTVVVHHQPVMPVTERRNQTKFYDQVKPLYDRYGVDLVLSGHDHGYSRGGIELEGKKEKVITGPVYVVSVAGPGMYALAYRDWYDRIASNTQLFQHVFMGDDELRFQTYTATGRLYDEFIIKKSLHEKRFIDLAPHIEEFTELPPSQRSRYNPDQLQKLEEQRRRYLERKQ